MERCSSEKFYHFTRAAGTICLRAGKPDDPDRKNECEEGLPVQASVEWLEKNLFSVSSLQHGAKNSSGAGQSSGEPACMSSGSRLDGLGGVGRFAG